MSKLTLIIFFVMINFSAMSFAKTYKIKKGKHESAGLQIGLFVSKELSFKAKFNNSAIYDLGNDNQFDVNKLFGFSDCYSLHHQNSARFGWRWNLERSRLEILGYVYHRGEREIALIDSVDLGKEYDYKILVHERTYEFQLNGKKLELPRQCGQNNAHGYKLYPYFGGDEVAPHEIKIEINR